MKLIYLVIASNDSNDLKQQIELLSDGVCSFVICIDASIEKERFLCLTGKRTDIFFVEDRVAMEWGDFSVVQAIINGLKFIVNNLKGHQRIILLDGLDYPIKSHISINNFFLDKPEQILLEYFKIPDKRLKNNGVNRYPYFRQVQKNMTIYGGSLYFSIPLAVAEFILNFIELNYDLVEYYKTVSIPSESFFQTLLLNSEESFVINNLVNENLHFNKLDKPYFRSNMIDEKLIDSLAVRNKLFINKLYFNKPSELLQNLKKFIYKKSTSFDSDLLNEPNKNIIINSECILYHLNKNHNQTSSELYRIKKAANKLNIEVEVKLQDHDNFSNNPDVDLFKDSRSRDNDSINLNTTKALNALLGYYLENDTYDFYWYINDMVYYNCPWEHLFCFFAMNDRKSDFLSTRITKLNYNQCESNLEHNTFTNLNINNIDVFKSFNPICRLSNAAIKLFINKLSTGWVGEYDILLPSLLNHNGFVINDFAGDGIFSRAAYKDKFYKTGLPDLTGKKIGASIREMTPIKNEEIRDQILYYPVNNQVNKTFYSTEQSVLEKESLNDRKIEISVIMPTYNQCYYIRRAIQSLLGQNFDNWELILINDGCTDDTEILILDFLKNDKIHYIKNLQNKGLGYCLNQGIEFAKYQYIAYLPSDDFYYRNHLSTIAEILQSPECYTFVYTTAKSEVFDSFGGQRVENEHQNGIFNTFGIQLVQVCHKKVHQKWIERDDYVTANLTDMYWQKLSEIGGIYYIEETTCNWSIHPFQRHKMIDEAFGGSLHKYRNHYGYENPLRIYLGQGKFVDEFELFPGGTTPKREKDGLKILLVGDLSYNHDRILALENEGCQLFGLWAGNVECWSNTGPLPFGNVVNIPNENWETVVRSLKPDIIYALLNHGAIDLAYEVFSSQLNVPFVWHFKEGPSVATLNGKWEKLLELYRKADGKIFINQESKNWYNQFIPFVDDDAICILDGDLARATYFKNNFSQKRSSQKNGIHTVVIGRMIGLTIEMIQELASLNIHIHVYPGNGLPFNTKALQVAPNHYHVHSFCQSHQWTNELSQYDAAWLHCIPSQNKGDITNLTWDDLNMPCRMNAYAAAGLPMILLKNEGNIVAMRDYLSSKDIAILFDNIEELAYKLHDTELLRSITENVVRVRMDFSFDNHVKSLINFFQTIIKTKHKNEATI